METTSKRFEEYVSLMAQSLGHADRVEPFRGYCTGLMLPVKRKSVEHRTGCARNTSVCITL
jgi:SRSO17 transposase